MISSIEISGLLRRTFNFQGELHWMFIHFVYYCSILTVRCSWKSSFSYSFRFSNSWFFVSRGSMSCIIVLTGLFTFVGLQKSSHRNFFLLWFFDQNLDNPKASEIAIIKLVCFSFVQSFVSPSLNVCFLTRRTKSKTRCFTG